MSLELTLNKPVFKSKTLLIGAAIVSAVVLPQLFHMAGIALGLGPALGETLLPMQIPVLLAALIAGPVVGAVSGLLSPLISFVSTGMPPAHILPFIMVELVSYGLIAGLLCRSKLPVFAKLIVAQIGGRILRIAAMFISVLFLGSHALNIAGMVSFIINGIPGILLQLCLVPLLISRIERFNRDVD